MSLSVPRTRQLLALAAVSVLAIAGCSDDGDQKQKKDPKPASEQNAIPQATQEPEPPADKQKVVHNVVLTADEVGGGVEEQDRDDTLGGVTNDICAKQWPSNEKRLAREQVHYFKKADAAEVAVSTEAVGYEKDQAKATVDEIEQAVEDCDGWTHKNGEMSDIASVDVPSGATGDTFAWGGTDKRSSVTYTYRAVYQTKGDYLAGLYVWTKDEDEADQKIEELTPKIAKNLKSS